MLKQRIVEDYFDSKTYSNQEILQKIEETKKEYHKKIIDVDININEFGVFVVTYYFKVSNNIFHKIFIKIKHRKKKNETKLLQEKSFSFDKKSRKERKQEKIKRRMEKYSGNKYGVYKETRTYKPY